MVIEQFRCGDLVPGCARSFVGSTEDILAGVARHARSDHGLSELSHDPVRAVQAAMTPAR